MASACVWRRLDRDMGRGGGITRSELPVWSLPAPSDITLRKSISPDTSTDRARPLSSDPHDARIPLHPVLLDKPSSSVPPRSTGLCQDCTQSAITGLVTSLASRKSKGRHFPQPYIYFHTSLPARSCTSITHQTHCQSQEAAFLAALDTSTLHSKAAPSLSPIDVG
ncbi:hypothetical protein K458DRAFT_106921 [Lentithecium fluviatile CBS 122367]|uniref:Uncharacterized protein n=1 Tax=Lentithecium fluviatile CBS 122367 TaxID=1168545 RepID=A0A6G1JJD7_9PLEO|nr:hypothetical protein K458DRAFT_106921 [Lentithecium fluviatile CBS 122367]